jgi:anti-sigma factor RsiW
MTAVSDEDLQAWVDGRLDDARRIEVEAHLAEHGEEAARARVYRVINDGLHALFDPVLNEPIPERLLARPARRWSSRTAVAAKAAALVCIGIAVGWVSRGLVPSAQVQALTLPRQAAIAHIVYAPEVRHPVEVGADEQDHLVRWLSKKLGTELKCPKLGAYGYELVGGRLLSGPNGPVAHFMFQDARGARLTLYVSGQRGDSRETAFRYSREDRVSVFYWIDGNYGYALSGELGREQLINIANAVYQQLNP